MVDVKIKWFVFILFLFSLAFAVYYTYFYSHPCNNYECFQEYMKKCDRASYLNEEPEASWQYKIIGENGRLCQIDVRLLNAKKGSLELERIVGYDMSCYYPLGIASYPDKDISKCNGRLKEEVQSIIIRKMQNYILENLGEIDNKLNGVS